MSLAEILSERPLGRKPFLQVIIDLTTLEKVGKFLATTAGTPQGGVLSPLLSSIALHGLENLINQEFPVNKAVYILTPNHC